MRRKKVWLGLLAVAMIASAFPAMADVAGIGITPGTYGRVSGIDITNDHLLNWGVATPGNVADFGSANNPWRPTQGAWAYEDSVLNAGFVGPGYGGQDFDAEALYTGFDVTNNTLYVALVTGFNIEGQVMGGVTYFAGDIFIDFGNYRPQNGQNPENNSNITSTNTAVPYNNTGHSWDLAFSLNGALATDTTRNAVRNFGIQGSPAPGQQGYNGGPLRATGGTVDGQAGFNYTANFGSTHRNLYQFAYQLDTTNALHAGWIDSLYSNNSGANGGWTVHWTMSCGNDYLDAAGYLVPVPAAAPMGLLGLGLAAFARRRKRAAA